MENLYNILKGDLKYCQNICLEIREELQTEVTHIIQKSHKLEYYTEVCVQLTYCIDRLYTNAGKPSHELEKFILEVEDIQKTFIEEILRSIVCEDNETPAIRAKVRIIQRIQKEFQLNDRLKWAFNFLKFYRVNYY